MHSKNCPQYNIFVCARGYSIKKSKDGIAHKPNDNRWSDAFMRWLLSIQFEMYECISSMCADLFRYLRIISIASLRSERVYVLIELLKKNLWMVYNEWAFIVGCNRDKNLATSFWSIEWAAMYIIILDVMKTLFFFYPNRFHG